jgi:hypothetical protein
MCKNCYIRDLVKEAAENCALPELDLTEHGCGYKRLIQQSFDSTEESCEWLEENGECSIEADINNAEWLGRWSQRRNWARHQRDCWRYEAQYLSSGHQNKIP